MGDLFDSVLDLEDNFIEEGRASGRRAAEQRGYEDGLGIGESKGGQLGEELGYYSGCVAAWRALFVLDPALSGAKNERAVRTLEQLDELLKAFPVDPTNESLFDALESIRSKFKQLASLLKVKQRFFATAGGNGSLNAASSPVREQSSDGGEKLRF